MKQLPDILEIITKSGYLKADLNSKRIFNINFLQLGSVLIENIRNEWNKNNKNTINTYFMQNNNINPISLLSLNEHKKHPNEFYKTNNFTENFNHVKNHFQKESPLAIAQENKYQNDSESNNLADDIIDIQLNQRTLLSCCYFFNDSTITEQFSKIQRERKIWWMKFSSNPARYNLSDLKTDLVNGHKTQSVKIKSKFQFGDIDVETVQMLPIKALQLPNQSEFSLKDVRLNKKIIPAIVKTEICMELAALGILFDAIEDTKNAKISLNRKIAPYQCALFCLADDDKILLELEDLATHLTNIIRKSGITALNLQKCYTKNDKVLQKELIQMDKIGVPYSIILETSSLQNGLMKLRNRDTTISEIIHITDIPDYLYKIFNA